MVKTFFGRCLQQLDIWAKNTIFGPKKGTFGRYGLKKACRAARNPKLPRDSLGYGDDILMLEEPVGVQKMEVYGCSVKKLDSLAKKMGLKPAHEPPVKSFQHKKSLLASFKQIFRMNHFWTHYTVIRCRFWRNTLFSETPCTKPNDTIPNQTKQYLAKLPTPLLQTFLTTSSQVAL